MKRFTSTFAPLSQLNVEILSNPSSVSALFLGRYTASSDSSLMRFAGVFAVPLGIFMAGRSEITLGFIGASVLFLPLFIFLPKLIQEAMKADADAGH